ncbi:MAG: MFS transporter [Candidatus Nanopelagicales bacterium]
MATPVNRQRVGPLQIAALSVGLTVGYLAGDLLPEVVNALQADLGMSDSMAGSLTTALLLATALTGLVFARRAGRPGRARFALAGALVSGAGFASAAFAPTTGVLIAGFVVAGVGSGVVLASATAAISTAPDPERASGLAILVNTFVGAMLLTVLPRITGTQATATFLFLALICLLVLPLFRWLPDAATPESESRAEDAPLPTPALGIVIFLGALILDLTDNGLWAFVGTIVMDNVGLSSADLGTILAVATIAGLAGAALPIIVGDRWGLFLPIIVMVGIDALAKILVVVVSQPVAYIVCQFLWTGSYAVLFAYLLAVGAALDSLGRWAAIVGSAFAMGDAIGPIVFGFTNDLGGTGSLIGLVVISSIAVALLLGPATLTLDRRRKAGRSPGDPADVGADALGP